MNAKPSNIGEMETQALKEQLAELEREVLRREAESRLRKARELEAKAQSMGFVSLAEAARTLSGLASDERTRPTYVNPDNPEQTWSGRGRKPKWVHEHMRKGMPIEALVPTSQG